MTALELHRRNPSLDLAPILRVIKYLGFDSNALSDEQVDRILDLYRHFEHDPELVVGIDAVCRLAEVDAERLATLLTEHRHEIPYLGNAAHPMVPSVGIGMIRALAHGDDPLTAQQELFTLTEMASYTGISMASLSKYAKEQPERIPSRRVGKMRKFPREAGAVFQQIKAENLGRRGNMLGQAGRHKAAVSRRQAAKLAALEQQVDAAFEMSRELARELSRLSRQVRRARIAADTGAEHPQAAPSTGRSRRTGGHRPDTIVAACKKVLANADGAMRVADITERVIAMGTPIKAKNPNVTVSSILSSYDDFNRVRRGYYELVELPPAAAAEQATPSRAQEKPLPTEAAARSADPDPDPREILAGLQKAATSADLDAAERPSDGASGDSSTPGRRGRTAGKQAREEAEPVIRLEPFGATS